MVSRTGPNLRGVRAGFTLVELLLAVVLVLLLLGAMVFNFATLRRGVDLEEGASQLESLFRFARAHAAANGRTVQIIFEEDVGDGSVVSFGNLDVVWEPDPLGAPGQFERLPEAIEFVRGITELVSVEKVRSIDPPGWSTSSSNEETTNAPNETLSLPPVTFYPDGSSDSTEIILASRDAEDQRRLALKLTAVTGAVRREWVDAETSEPFPEPVSPVADPSLDNTGHPANPVRSTK
jgi:prepilin-type N-terminal cleavage/methylation domain-containing protein